MMDVSAQEEDEGYCTFIALNRPAMLWGFPIKVLLVGFPALVISAFVFPLLFGFWGIVPPLLVAALLLAIKGACEMDPRKPEKLFLRLRAFMTRIAGSKGGIYLLKGAPDEKYDRRRIAEHFSCVSQETH